jgi:copper chaperone NosL
MTRRRFVVTLASVTAGAVLLPAAACRASEARLVPAAILFGRDECAYCRMTVDDPKLAAQFVARRGAALSFGEPGCLLAWLAEHPEADGAPFVAAAEDGRWLDAAAARYTRGGTRTPMRFDIVAHAPSAGAAVAPLTWPELRREGRPAVHAS